MKFVYTETQDKERVAIIQLDEYTTLTITCQGYQIGTLSFVYQINLSGHFSYRISNSMEAQGFMYGILYTYDSSLNLPSRFWSYLHGLEE